MTNLKETHLNSTHIFKGRLLDVWSDEVKLPNGHNSVREYIKHPGAVVIIPVLPNDSLLLIRQFRYPMSELEIELPAGKIDEDESLDETANRELKEETGYISNKLTRLAEIHPCIGYSNERMWLYLAEDLTEVGAEPDPDEFVELMPLSLDECIAMLKRGEIKDTKTIVGLFWAEKILNGKWSPQQTK